MDCMRCWNMGARRVTGARSLVVRSMLSGFDNVVLYSCLVPVLKVIWWSRTDGRTATIELASATERSRKPIQCFQDTMRMAGDDKGTISSKENEKTRPEKLIKNKSAQTQIYLPIIGHHYPPCGSTNTSVNETHHQQPSISNKFLQNTFQRYQQARSFWCPTRPTMCQPTTPGCRTPTFKPPQHQNP